MEHLDGRQKQLKSAYCFRVFDNRVGMALIDRRDGGVDAVKIRRQKGNIGGGCQDPR